MQLVSKVTFSIRSFKIGISRLSSECGNNNFPDAVCFTLQQKLRLVFNDVDRRKISWARLPKGIMNGICTIHIYLSKRLQNQIGINL
jgi:hypothetical protein